MLYRGVATKTTMVDYKLVEAALKLVDLSVRVVKRLIFMLFHLVLNMELLMFLL